MAVVDYGEHFHDRLSSYVSEFVWSKSSLKDGCDVCVPGLQTGNANENQTYALHAGGDGKVGKLDSTPCLGHYGDLLGSGGDELDAKANSLSKIEALWTAFENSNKSRDILTASDTYRPFIESTIRPAPESRKPFRKWIRSLHRRQRQRKPISHISETGEASRQKHGIEPSHTRSLYEHRSSSASSYAFVVHAKDASMSLASTGVATARQKKAWRSSRGHSRAECTSRTSASGRHSEDSQFQDVPLRNDALVADRALKRRRILEELIGTEEGYIGDLRCLINEYMTIVAPLPSMRTGLRSSIKSNLTDIIELHEELLGDLHRAVPDFEYEQLDVSDPKDAETLLHRHHRRCTVDAVPDGKSRLQWLQEIPGMISEPPVAAEVAKVFVKKMNRFFIYEEYGAKHEMMIKDVDAAKRIISQWDRNQRGLETWASLTGSSKEASDSKKALTIYDLLTKPIQRLCKYPLLFAELLKITPVCDCPYSYMEIENTLARLREVTDAVNRATDDILVKATLEQTWRLQDRLVFPDQRMDAIAKSHIRGLGHIQLCGVLHVCWQTKDSVTGKYMICLLYRDWLCLATGETTGQVYTIQACIPMNTCNLEEADNNRGLQCHTAPFSWKIVFECDFQLYEILMTACTPKEGWEWRQRLGRKAATDDGHTQPETSNSSFLALNIRSLGTVFGKPGTVARGLSIRRATTIGTKSPLCQVILKNTSTERLNAGVSPKQTSINRSQSLQADSRAPVLAPPRAGRIRLEALVSDVWSRDILPFPGITIRAKSDRPSKSAATSLMRKLSVASLASTFGRRSMGRSSASNRNGIEMSDFEGGTAPPTSYLSSVPVEDQVSTESHANGPQEDKNTGTELGQYDHCVAPLPERDDTATDLFLRDKNTQHDEDARGDAVESSALREALRASIVRLFEENKELQPNRKKLRHNRAAQLETIKANGLRGSSCNQPATEPVEQVREVVDAKEARKAQEAQEVHEADCRRQASALGYMVSRSSLSLSRRDSILETMCPLSRQPARGEHPVQRPRRWSRANIFHRSALRQSLRDAFR